MPIAFNCPHCGVLYKLDEKYAGKMGKCKNAKCQKQILIPFQSTAAAGAVAGNDPATTSNPIDAEALAAAAFSDDKPFSPPDPAQSAPAAFAKKIAVTCSVCEHKFEADAAMAGKNSPCPECGKIIRIPKLVEEKPIDWRNTNAGKPSLAKAAEPVPAGVWDGQAKGVSGEALRQANALNVEDDEEPGERRLRRIKQALYGVAIVGVLFLGIRYMLRVRSESKDDRKMELAVREIEDKNVGSKKPEFHSGVHRLAGEYAIRSANKPEDIQQALQFFDKSRDAVQNLPPGNEDRSAMLAEIGSALVVCGGTPAEIDADKRLPWDKVHPLIRKCVDKLPSADMEARSRALRSLTRKLVEHNQGPVAATVARNSSSEAEQPETLGRVGIELFLLNKREQAKEVLERLSSFNQPAATALWLALHPDAPRPPGNVAHVPPPGARIKGPARDSRLAYAEGWALQGKFGEARQTARMPGSIADQVEALTRVAAVAAGAGKSDEAAQVLEEIAGLVKPESKTALAAGWVLASAIEQAAIANRYDLVPGMLEAIRDERIRAWAKLGVLRVKLASQPGTKADETWLDLIAQPERATLAQALAQAEVARHNAAAGEGSYARGMDSLPVGTLRPFGYAGTALGTQDRSIKR